MLAHGDRKHAEELRKKYFDGFLEKEKSNVSSIIALYRYKSFFTNLYEYMIPVGTESEIEKALLNLTDTHAEKFIQFMHDKRRPRYAQNGVATIREFYRYMQREGKCSTVPFVFQSSYPLQQTEYDLVQKFSSSLVGDAKNKDYKSKRSVKALIDLHSLSGRKDGMLTTLSKTEIETATKKLTPETKSYASIWRSYYKYLLDAGNITQTPVEIDVMPDNFITDYQTHLTQRQSTPHSIRELRSHILRLYKLLPTRKPVTTLTKPEILQIIGKVQTQVKHDRAIQFVATWRRFFSFLKDHLKNSELSILVDACQLD